MKRSLLLFCHKYLFKFLIALSISLLCGASNLPQQGLEPQKGIAVGTVMLQGYCPLDAPGQLTFYNVGKTGADPAYAVARLSCDCSKLNSTCTTFEIQGTFSGGPNGVASFVTELGADINAPLHDGKTFFTSVPGFQINMTVTDPSIFEIEEEKTGTEAEPEPTIPERIDTGTRVSDRSGQVEIACPPDFDTWDVMKENSIVYVDCHVKTGEDSEVTLSFSDMTTLRIPAESEVAINVNPAQPGKFTVLAGKTWANIKNMIQGNEMEIRMGHAVLGIKGTTLVLEENGPASSVKVLEGIVRFESLVTGESMEVHAGEWLAADKNGLGEMQQFDIAAEEKFWDRPPVAEEVIQSTPAAGNDQPDAKSYPIMVIALLAAVAGIGFAGLIVIIGGLWFLLKRKSNGK